jgi:hypothetical protein
MTREELSAKEAERISFAVVAAIGSIVSVKTSFCENPLVREVGVLVGK